MTTAMRQPTLETLGLGTVLGIFTKGRLPADTGSLVDQVFGNSGNRGALVITGGNGIVGAGKSIQLGSRLEPYGIPLVAIDLPGAAPGIAKQYPGLVKAFGKDSAGKIISNIVQLTYDGSRLPAQLSNYRPRFLLEAIPEILELKRAHYELFRSDFPGIEIRSVTSGFPSRLLGVGIAHPSFPHNINKVWEIVEPSPSPVTQLFWSLGLIPIMVSDDWSFVLDVLFTGVTLAGVRYHEATNMPFWKIDKYIQNLLGPNPFRAHDFIGARGSNFLTWSCLHHLAEHYGPLFKPTAAFTERKDSGQEWYPPNHFRPMVNWALDGDELDELHAWILGPMFQMASLIIHEKRSHLSQINAIGELCAQFRRGMPAVIRGYGADAVVRMVERYHRLHPEAAQSPWRPEAFESMGSGEWQQLYVNAEHDGKTGIITLSRESYNPDVDAELNRAIDWLKAQGVKRVILTGDFHLSTQLVGADTTNFFPALDDLEKGIALSRDWSGTARRLYAEFATSVGFINGKRCLGGMLELMQHCHYVVAVDSAELGLPEVTLPVVPGMEGCHWIFRKTAPEHWSKLLTFLLEGKPVRAADGIGWLVDYAGSTEDAIRACWAIANGEANIPRRTLVETPLKDVTRQLPGLRPAQNANMEAARRAILETVQNACEATLGEALLIQARLSGNFMTTSSCRTGAIGAAYAKTAL